MRGRLHGVVVSSLCSEKSVLATVTFITIVTRMWFVTEATVLEKTFTLGRLDI
jgi:hypothetical protein